MCMNSASQALRPPTRTSLQSFKIRTCAMASSSIAFRKVSLWQSVLLASYILALGSNVALAVPLIIFPLLPPLGNELEGTFTGQGVQLYQCTQDSASGNLTWKHTGAEATLTAKDSYTVTHYFQSQPDALGGKATFAATSKDESDVNSTVTGLVLHSAPDVDPSSNIESLLLVATSHSGPGFLGATSYIQRLHSQGGVAPAASTCTVRKLNLTQSVPYNATYSFYRQTPAPPTTYLPASLAVPADYKPLWSWYATGSITYRSNGTWQVVSDKADLSYLPGSLVVGSHSVDAGAHSWSTYLAQSIKVQGTLIASEHVWPGALDWLLLRVTAEVGSGNATIGYAHRVSTRGGLPSSEQKSPIPIDTVVVPYSAVFWFYGWW